MAKTIQIGLFMNDPPTADTVAAACYGGQPIKSMVKQAEGSAVELDGALARRVNSQVHPGRVDFYWEVPQVPPSFVPEGELDLAALAPTFETIFEYASTLDIQRVAWISVVRRFAASAEEAVEWIGGQLPAVKVAEGATEFTYRANVPKAVSGLGLNRIITWQAAPVVILQLSGAAFKQLNQYLSEIQFDVNTLQEVLLGAGQAGNALRSARDEGLKLLEQGFEGL